MTSITNNLDQYKSSIMFVLAFCYSPY